MPPLRIIGFSCALAAAALVPVAVAPASLAVVGCKSEAGKQIAFTPNFRFTLRLGAVENMFMPRQVRANHLKHGEVMMRGTMSGPGLMTGGPIRHLEIQICARLTRSVVTNARPKIIVVDTTARRKVVLPVAVMEDISAGDADLHYGNNIAMATGHRFRVAVAWKRERATFDLVAPPVRG